MSKLTQQETYLIEIDVQTFFLNISLSMVSTHATCQSYDFQLGEKSPLGNIRTRLVNSMLATDGFPTQTCQKSRFGRVLSEREG
jgi:hypothetical protein